MATPKKQPTLKPTTTAPTLPKKPYTITIVNPLRMQPQKKVL